MFSGLRITTAATLMMSAALFTRRSRTGWLDELDDIRGSALAAPDGEVAHAMADVTPMDDGATSPLADLEAYLPSAAWSPFGPVSEVEPDPVGDRVEAEVDPVPAVEAAAAPPPPPPSVDLSTLPPPPAAAAPLPPPTVDEAPAPVDEALDEGPTVVQPSPHPIRPHEMWHPQVVVPAAARAEERLDPADLLGDDDGGTAARFRFARLRAVTPDGDELVAPEHGDDPGPFGASPRVEADLFATEPKPPVEDPALGLDTPPLVPDRGPAVGGALITGPVPRRRRSDHAVGRRAAERAAADSAVDADAHQVIADAVDPSDLAAEPAWRWIPDAELPDAAEAPEAPADEPPVRLPIGVDGTVAVEAGILRLAGGLDVAVESGPDGIDLALASGWCWADRPDGSVPVTVALPIGTLTIPAGAATLVVVEADGSAFVVVVGGEALLQHAGGRLRLRAGAMALAPVGADPQVDVASEPEILADPLVQLNLRLDGAQASAP